MVEKGLETLNALETACVRMGTGRDWLDSSEDRRETE